MDVSCEIAHIHMRNDAKNPVITARTIHLPEQKETIHTISMLRRQTKPSAKADNLITSSENKKIIRC